MVLLRCTLPQSIKAIRSSIKNYNTLSSVLKEIISQASQKLLEPTLQDDPITQVKLAKLAGKVIAFHLKKINQTFYFLPNEHHLAIENEVPTKVDVTIRAKPSTILKIVRDGIDDANLDAGELEIEGDAITGQRFATLLNELQIDWEELLSQRIGDVPAHIISSGISQLMTWSKDTQITMKQNMAEYLTEEARLAASRMAIEKYLDQVDELRNDVARLSARITQLKNV